MEFSNDFTTISSLFLNLALMSLSTPLALKHALIILLIKTFFFSFYFLLLFRLRFVKRCWRRFKKNTRTMRSYLKYRSRTMLSYLRKSYIPYYENETKKKKNANRKNILKTIRIFSLIIFSIYCCWYDLTEWIHAVMHANTLDDFTLKRI